jgi:hypothetical protein
MRPLPVCLAGSAVSALLTAACGGAPAAPSAIPDAGNLQYATSHFVFHYDPADAARVPAIATAAEAEYARIVSELQVASMPVVHVRYYQTHAALAAAVRPIAGAIPSWASGLVTGPDQIHLLSPAATGAATAEAAAVNVVHEFAHCVTLQLEPRSANNPRWLWETVALYEARQFVDPSRLGYLVAGQPPSLADLSSFDNTRVYDVGYLIGEFIVQRWGQPALPALVRARGDTQAALGISQPEFERDWYAAVRVRYRI